MIAVIYILIIVSLLMLAVLALRTLQRAFFYPPPRGMPKDVESDIDRTLQRLETVLREHAPDVLSALQPGLSDDQIREIESAHRLRLTDELRALYRWRNGSSSDDRAELVPGHWFLPLDYT